MQQRVTLKESRAHFQWFIPLTNSPRSILSPLTILARKPEEAIQGTPGHLGSPESLLFQCGNEVPFSPFIGLCYRLLQ